MTEIETAGGLVEHLRAEYGSALRAVASYDREGYTLHYVEERVEVQYSPDDMDAIYDDIVLQEITQPLHEELFTGLGDIEGKIRLLEEGTVAHFWPTEEDEGLFLSFGSNADPGVRSLLDLAQSYYS